MRNNLRLLALMQRIQPKYNLYLAINIVISGLTPLLHVFMPAAILQALLGQAELNVLIMLVVCYASASALLRLIPGWLDKRGSAVTRLGVIELNQMVAQKSLALPFEYAESKSGMDNYERARFGLFNVFNFASLMNSGGTALLSLVSLSIVVLSEIPWALGLIVVANLLTIPLLRKLNQLEIDDAKRGVPENRTFSFCCSLCRDWRYTKDLRLYNGSDFMLAKTKTVMDRILKINSEYFTRAGIINGVTAMLMEAQTIILFFFLGSMLFQGRLTIPAFTALYTACRGLSTALREFMRTVTGFLKYNIMLEPSISFLALDEREAAEKSKPVSTSADNDEALIRCRSLLKQGVCEIEVENLNFSYPNADQPCLENINFQIKNGERLALVGTNGAGKSTIVKLLARFYALSEGSIRLNGVDINRIPEDEYRRLLAPTFQDFRLFPFKISENLCTKIEAEISPDEQVAVDEALRKLGLKTWVDTLPDGSSQYLYSAFSENGLVPSGGQGQKLALCRSLLQNGAFLIMDEPTAALDPRSEEEIFKEMMNISHGKSTLMITHRLSSTRYADRILVMDKGRIVENGTHDELMANSGLYARMYLTQAEQYQ